MASRLDGDYHFTGAVTMNEMNIPAGTIVNTDVAAGAAISASKLESRLELTYAQDRDAMAHRASHIIHSGYGATGDIIAFEAGCAVIGGAGASVDVDLLLNGTSVLSAAITLDSSNTALTPEEATLATLIYADGGTFEVVVTPKGPGVTPVDHMEDFLGDAGDTLPGLWGVDAQTANSVEDYVTDSAGGVYSIQNEATSEAQSTQLFSNDNLWIDLFEQPIIDFRVNLDLTGTNGLGSADQRWVIGVCSAHTNAEDDLDATTVNSWFRQEGTAADILVEADDGTLNTDDQDSTINLVDNTYTNFRIDFTSLTDVKYYIDGVEQGGAAMSMTNIASTTLVQPIVCLQRDAGTEAEKIYIDFIKVHVNRTTSTLAKGVYATVVLNEDAS